MNPNTPSSSTPQNKYALSPRLIKLKKPLLCVLIASIVLQVLVVVIFNGYYSDAIMNLALTAALLAINSSLLATIVWPSRKKQPSKALSTASEALFVIILINLIVALLALWGTLPNSGIILRYCCIVIPLVLAPMTLHSIFQAEVSNVLGVWAKYIGAFAITIGLLMLIPIMYHYIGKSWFEIMLSPQLPQLYFNIFNLAFFISIGSSFTLAALKWQKQGTLRN